MTISRSCRSRCIRVDIVEQARAGELQEIEAEARILVIEFLELLVVDFQHLALFQAFQRLRSLAVGGEEGEFADDRAIAERDAEFAHQEFSGHHEEHAVGDVALAEHDRARFHVALGRERLDPFHRMIAGGRFLDRADELSHFVQAVAVERQQDRSAAPASDRRRRAIRTRPTPHCAGCRRCAAGSWCASSAWRRRAPRWHSRRVRGRS